MIQSLPAARLTAITLLMSLTIPVSADILGGSVGVNIWAQSLDASARDGGDTIDFDSDFDLDDEADYHFYASLEHPVPLIPNILIQRTQSEINGDGFIDDTTFDGEDFAGEVDTELDLSHTEATLYYEILDNWVALDIGISARRYDGSVLLIDSDGTRAEEDIDDILPLLYVAAQFDLPFTGWQIKAAAQHTEWDDDTITDARGAVAWESPIGFGVEVGYRYMDIDYESGSTELDATLEGVYGGLFWDF